MSENSHSPDKFQEMSEKDRVDIITIDDDTDTGDSEFEPPDDAACMKDDDSIAPEDDVTDEEEVNGLMKESEEPLDEVLARIYGISVLPGSSAAAGTSTPTEGLARKRRRNGSFSGSTPAPASSSGVDSNSSQQQKTPIEIDLTLGNSSGEHDSAEQNPGVAAATAAAPVKVDLIDDDDDDAAADGDFEEEDEDGDEDDDILEEEEEEGEDVDSETRRNSVALWCRALVDDNCTPAYNSEEDEDYQPNVEGEGDWRGEMRVGEEYQAEIGAGPLAAPQRDDSHLAEEAQLLWRPDRLSDEQVEIYQHNYQATISQMSCMTQVANSPPGKVPHSDDEEALFLLLRSDFDIDEALQRLRLKTIPPHEIVPSVQAWTEAEVVAFEKGISSFNKNFFQIHQLKMRHKPVRELVNFYYFWKKTPRYDEFAMVHRRNKKRSLVPAVTDFMDVLYDAKMAALSSSANNSAGATMTSTDPGVNGPTNPPADERQSSQSSNNVDVVVISDSEETFKGDH